MKHLRQAAYRRSLCLVLAMIMVFSMIQPVHIHAAEPKFVLTDQSGKPASTFTTGDPIYITAAETTGDDEWFGVYRVYEDGHWDSFYYMWAYAKDLRQPTLLSDCVWYGLLQGPNTLPSDGICMEPGTYAVWWGDAGSARLTQEVCQFTLTAPETLTAKLDVDKETLTLGEKVRITATNRNSYSWVGVYAGNVSSAAGLESQEFYYCQGRNGLAMEFTPLKTGEYTVLMYDDYNSTILSGEKHFTVQGTDINYMSLAKKTFAYGDEISVTTVARPGNGGDWVGLYKKGETYDPSVGGAFAIFWYNAPAGGGTVTINAAANDYNGRGSEFVAGEYTLVYFFDGGYIANETIDITITKTETGRTMTKEASCEEAGEARITYSDGTTGTEPILALGHDTEGQKWVYDKTLRKHHKLCKRENCGKKVDVADCTFGEGVVTSGEKVYTCETCKGTYSEPYSNKEIDHIETKQDATCVLPKIEMIYYKDGTSEEKVGTALGHDLRGDYIFDEKNHQHYQKCQRTDCEAKGTPAACDFGEGQVANGKITYTCETCHGSYSAKMMELDQASYPWSANLSIRVSTILRPGHAKDWVAMYKKGDNYGQGVGTITSIYYYYPAEVGETADITEYLNSFMDRSGEVKAGTYVIYYFADDGYQILDSVEFTITKTETGRTTTREASCEEAGEELVTYSDGTTERVETPALKHIWSEKLVFDKESRSHAYVCQRDKTHTKDKAACSFGEPEVSEPAGNRPGTKKYTCVHCGGSYTQEFFDKKVKDEEIITPASCETAGVKKVIYEDDTFAMVEIPATGHAYPKNWSYDKQMLQHKKVCANDKTHVVWEPCAFGTGVVSGKQVTYQCSVCGGQRTTSVLHTDKTTISQNEPLLIVAYAEDPNAWVGLYKRGDQPDPTNGGVVSIYWRNVANGQSVDLLDKANYNPERGEDVAPGKYTVYLFGDGGYSNIVAQMDITIEEAKQRPTLALTINGETGKNGANLTLTEGDKVKVQVTGQGELGRSWMGVFNGKLSTAVDFTNISSVYWKYIREINGREFDLAGAMGLSDLAVGQYTIVLFSDGGKSDPQLAVCLTVQRKTSNEQILLEPTCTEYGKKLVTYDDGNREYLFIDPLGHWGEKEDWTYDADTHSHSGVCRRCETSVVEDCHFLPDEQTDPQTYTCTICGGHYVDDGSVGGWGASRLYGSDRFQTAFAVADQLKQVYGVENFDTILIASGADFADAQSGAYLANLKHAPILLSYHDTYNALVAEYIQKNLSLDGQVYILGGEKAVPASMERMLREKGVGSIKRLSGKNRFETNLEILKESGFNGDELLVCTGTNFADVLSASAVDKPILMVHTELYADQREYLEGLSLDMCYIIGGTGAVNTKVEAALRDYCGATKRLGGADRYETSVLIAREFFNDCDEVMLTYGRNYPDGLCGGMLANSLGMPLVLTESGKWSASAVKYAKDENIHKGIVLGGAQLITDETVRSIFAMDPAEQIRVIFHNK